MIEVQTNIDYLIPYLRLHLGDLNPASYRYLDSWLRTALIASVRTLSRFWDSKYLVGSEIDTITEEALSGVPYSGVIRNTLFTYFEFQAPPTVQVKDEAPIILMASIIIKSGSLENLSWDLGSWRDAEQQFSNIKSGDAKDASIARDWKALYDILKPPVKRLFNARRTDWVEQV